MKKKKGKRKLNLKKLGINAAISAIISGAVTWYFVGFFFSLFSAYQLVINPFSFVRIYRNYGVPWNALIIGFSLLFLGLLCWLYLSSRNKLEKDDRNFRYSDSGVYGTARFLEDEDMADLALVQGPYEAMGTILAQKDQTGTKLINQKDKTRINKHICVFGASQSGKTYSFVLPFCLQAARRRESLVVTDPKGELYETTAEYFRSLGYTVRCLNLKEPQRSDGWDCLKELFVSNQDPDQRAQIFANIVSSNMGGGKDSGDIHTAAPELLLTALLLRVGLDKSNQESGINTFETLLGIFENDRGVSYIDGELFGENAPPEVEIAKRTYQRFKMASDNLYGNIIVGLATKLNPLTSTVIKKVISTDDIDLTLPGKKPCVYYCIMSDMHSALNFISALFFSFLFLDLTEYADSLPERKLPIPVNFLLDEFANCGSIPDFDKKVSVVRSRAINISIILQDINQLKDRYPKTWQSIMSNCATHLCIGFNDPDTEAYYSERTGETTVKVTTNQHEKVEPVISLGHKHSTGDGRRAVMDRSELARMSLDECLVVFQSKNALKAYKFPVDKHPDYKKLKQCSINDIPSIMDTGARELRKKEEEERIAKFEEWLANGGDPFPELKRSQTDSERDRKKKWPWEKHKAAEQPDNSTPNEPIEDEILDLDAFSEEIDEPSSEELPADSVTEADEKKTDQNDNEDCPRSEEESFDLDFEDSAFREDTDIEF